MSGYENLYVGNAKEYHREGREPYLLLDISLGQLREKLKEEHKHVWKDKDGNTHKHVKLVVAPLKPENVTERRTHSVKIDTWKPDPDRRKPVRRDDPPAAKAVRDMFGPEDDDAGMENVPF